MSLVEFEGREVRLSEKHPTKGPMQLGLDDVFQECLPEDDQRIIRLAAVAFRWWCGELESEGRKVSRDTAERLATKAQQLLNRDRNSFTVEGRTLLDETKWVVRVVNNDGRIIDTTGAGYDNRWRQHERELGAYDDNPDYLIGAMLLHARRLYDEETHPEIVKDWLLQEGREVSLAALIDGKKISKGMYTKWDDGVAFYDNTAWWEGVGVSCRDFS